MVVIKDLDMWDKKILYELDRNSRQTLSEIAKKVRLSKAGVAYRIQKLQEKGIIRKFHTIINIGKLGLIGFRLYINLINTTPSKEQEIIKHLTEKKQVTWLATLEGKYNLAAFIIVKDIEEINNIWEELLDKYINYIDHRYLTIISKMNYYSIGYLLDKERTNFDLITTTPPDKTIDSKDLSMLKALADDSDIQIIKLSRIVGLTPKTIIKRKKILKQKGVIVGYKTFIDLKRLNYEHYKVSFRLLKITKDKEMEFNEYAKQHPNIVYREKHLGGDDLEIGVHVRNMQELRSILDALKERFSDIIHDYMILHIYEEHKNSFLPK